MSTSFSHVYVQNVHVPLHLREWLAFFRQYYIFPKQISVFIFCIYFYGYRSPNYEVEVVITVKDTEVIKKAKCVKLFFFLSCFHTFPANLCSDCEQNQMCKELKCITYKQNYLKLKHNQCLVTRLANISKTFKLWCHSCINNTRCYLVFWVLMQRKLLPSYLYYVWSTGRSGLLGDIHHWTNLPNQTSFFLPDSPPSSNSHQTSTVPFPCFFWNCWLASSSLWSDTFSGTVGLFLSAGMFAKDTHVHHRTHKQHQQNKSSFRWQHKQSLLSFVGLLGVLRVELRLDNSQTSQMD